MDRNPGIGPSTLAGMKKRAMWDEITGNGYAARHDPDGDYLYGMEVCVDEDYRGFRIGQRLYSARKQLCLN